MSKSKLVEEYEQQLIQAVLRYVEDSPGLTANSCANFLFEQSAYAKAHTHEVIDKLVATGYIECDSNKLYPNKKMPEMTLYSLEGLRFTPKASVGIVANDIWRVDEFSNLIEIHDEPVGTTTVIPKEGWFEEFTYGNYESICSLCVNNIVRHSQKQIYPICANCYRYMMKKPHIRGKQNITYCINNMRTHADEIVTRDLMLFEAVQENISGESHDLENALFN